MDDRALAGDPSNDPGFLQLVLDLPSKLPEGCRIVNTYQPIGGALASPPLVTVVETNDPGDLNFISNYYRGYLEYQWTPAFVLGPTRADRERSLEVANSR